MKKLVFAAFLTAAVMLAQSTPAQTDTSKPAHSAKVKKHRKHKKDAASATSTTSNSTAVKPAAKK